MSSALQIPAQQRPVRIGIDYGDTIGLLSQDPAPHAFDMIRHLVHKFGAAHVFIISKAGPSIEQKIRQWFLTYDFYNATGVWPHHVVFVRAYADKAVWVQRLGISIFFDDSIKILRTVLPLVERFFWMHATPADLRRHVPKEYRDRVVLTQHWAQTMKHFQKIPAQPASAEREEEEASP